MKPNVARWLPCLVVLLAPQALAEDAPLPPPPKNTTSTMRGTLSHGVRLLAAGDFEFARGHFAGVRPPQPTRVFINTGGLPQGYRRRAYEAALAAMSGWTRAMPDLVEFIETTDEDRAHVAVNFEYDVASQENSAVKLVCGTTNARMFHDGNEVDRSAVIRVALYGEGSGKPAHSSASLTHVVGHELGHFLGLGESEDKRDLMGPDDHQGVPSLKPSSRDAQRLTDLIQLGDELAALAERGRKVPLSKEWQAFSGAKPAAPKRTAPSATSPKPGEKAPDFTLGGLDGKEHKLSDFAGKPVLLDFWATWCGPCRADLPNLKKLVAKYVPQGLVVIGISLDSDEKKLRDFVKAESMDWLQLFDGQGWKNALAQQYKVQAIPQALLVGPDGTIVRREYRATAFEDDIAKVVGGAK